MRPAKFSAVDETIRKKNWFPEPSLPWKLFPGISGLARFIVLYPCMQKFDWRNEQRQCILPFDCGSSFHPHAFGILNKFSKSRPLCKRFISFSFSSSQNPAILSLQFYSE